MKPSIKPTEFLKKKYSSSDYEYKEMAYPIVDTIGDELDNRFIDKTEVLKKLQTTIDDFEKEIKEYRIRYGYAQESHFKGECSTCDAIRLLDKCEELLEQLKSELK